MKSLLYTCLNSRIVFVSLLRSSLFIYNFETLSLKTSLRLLIHILQRSYGAHFSYPYKLYKKLSSVGATCFKILLLTTGYLLNFHKPSFLQPPPPQQQHTTTITTTLLLSGMLLNYHSCVKYKVLLSYISVAAL